MRSKSISNLKFINIPRKYFGIPLKYFNNNSKNGKDMVEVQRLIDHKFPKNDNFIYIKYTNSISYLSWYSKPYL